MIGIYSPNTNESAIGELNGRARIVSTIRHAALRQLGKNLPGGAWTACDVANARVTADARSPDHYPVWDQYVLGEHVS